MSARRSVQCYLTQRIDEAYCAKRTGRVFFSVETFTRFSGLSKKMLLFSAVLVCCVKSALSGITTGPEVQRIIYVGETATFQWSVTGSISNVSVHNQTLGYPGPLNANADYMMDNRSGMVILIINNVQLYDAGNYSLSVTIGTTTQTDASALLFVYGSPIIVVNQTFGGSSRKPATEGDAVELTCTAISTSLPVAYRPKVIYYQWSLPWIGELRNISSGQARPLYSNDLVPGYSIKNDGRTLVIASAQYRDTKGIKCSVQEQWSWIQHSSSFDLPLKYRPFIYSPSPVSRKFTAIVGDPVSLSFYIRASPYAISATNWSFINTSGHAHDLPFGFSYSKPYYAYNPTSLEFNLTSEAYYGNYSITLSNSIGATTETFQVLGLGPPDAPSSVRVNFLSHYLIAISWNSMWSNGRPQTIFLQLRTSNNDSIIESQNTPVSLYSFNSTYTTQFWNGIEAETNHEVRVWSTNNLGSSDVVKLSVRTPEVFKFFVSPKTISFNGNQAIVNFSATEGKIVNLFVQCCVEFTRLCDRNTYYDVNGTSGQLKFDITQSGDVYVFDFRVYDGAPPKDFLYYLAEVKELRVSRNGETDEPDDEKPDDEKPDDDKPDDNKPDDKIPDDNKPDDKIPDDNKPDDKIPDDNKPDDKIPDDNKPDDKIPDVNKPADEKPDDVAVIVLGVLLGVVVLALIGCVVAIVVLKRRHNTPSNHL